MTSSVAGVRWNKHPLLDHALGGPTPVKLHLKFVVWNPADGTFEPVKGATVSVIKTDANGGGTGTLQAAQSSSTGLTDLSKTTNDTGVVSFEGMIQLVPSGGLTVYFDLSGLSVVDWYNDGSQGMKKIGIDTWSTAGWKSQDTLSDGTIEGFTGQQFGSPDAPITFLVGMPCWLEFRYQRYFGESPAALFPSGTKIRLIALDASEEQIESFEEFTTDADARLKTVLFNFKAGTNLRGLIYISFEKAIGDNLVLNPFAIATDDNEFLWTEDSENYAFHFTCSAATLKQVEPWIKVTDTFSLCDWDNQAKAVGAHTVLMDMPLEFQSSQSFGDLGPKIRERITRCTALHVATLVRELHGFLSSVLVGRSEWQGLNLHPESYEIAVVFSKNSGPETAPVGPGPAPLLRGVLYIPLKRFFDSNAFKIPATDINLDRYHAIRNVIMHEFAHSVMFRYIYNDAEDSSSLIDHCLNLFIDYSTEGWTALPFWEGWAVYFSMLFLSPSEFLRAQMIRVAAIDKNIDRDQQLALIGGKTDQALMSIIENIFGSGLIPTFLFDDQNIFTANKKARTLEYIKSKISGNDIGKASELCLAFSLYNLTRLIVTQNGGTLTNVKESDGSGNVSGASWYANSDIGNELWAAIFKPFMSLNTPYVPGEPNPDTIVKFTTFISDGLLGAPDWQTKWQPRWHKIKKIFNTYYLLIESPAITSVQPATMHVSSAPQTLTISGTGFVEDSSSPGDGGLSVAITGPSSMAPGGINVLFGSVTSNTSLTVTVVFPVAGDYTLNLLGRWGAVSHIVTVSL